MAEHPISKSPEGFYRYEWSPCIPPLAFSGRHINIISKILNFDYEIRIVADGNYGSMDKDTGQWNGMIGELLSQVIN